MPKRVVKLIPEMDEDADRLRAEWHELHTIHARPGRRLAPGCLASRHFVRSRRTDSLLRKGVRIIKLLALDALGDTVPGPAAQRDLPFALTRRFTIVGLRVNGLRILTVPISKISE